MLALVVVAVDSTDTFRECPFFAKDDKDSFEKNFRKGLLPVGFLVGCVRVLELIILLRRLETP